MNADALSRLHSTSSIVESSQGTLIEPFKLKQVEVDDINAEYLHLSFDNTVVQATPKIRREIGETYEHDRLYDVPSEQLRKIKGSKDPSKGVEYQSFVFAWQNGVDLIFSEV